MGVTKLSLDLEYDFSLIGLRSDARESRIAWELERKLLIQIQKSEDVLLEFIGDSSLTISCMECVEWPNELMILKNKAVKVEKMKQSFLMPELKQFDYFIRLEDQFEEQLDDVFGIVKSLPVVQYCQLLVVEDLKSKDNLLF